MATLDDPGPPISARTAVDEALARFHRIFAAGDAEALTGLFASDARLLLLHREPLVGREAIREHWTRVFGAYDTSAWLAEPVIVDVHGDRAYTLSTYTETLVPRGRRGVAARRRAADPLLSARPRWRLAVSRSP